MGGPPPANEPLTASLTLDPAFDVAPVNRRTFGSFVEHMGRCVYTGLYEPEHPSADDDGFRRDVLELIEELGVTLVRYPGGNFVSGYRWEDGVGPVEARPTRLDLAWHSIETNAFGLDEFMRWTRKADVEPMLAVNLGAPGAVGAKRLATLLADGDVRATNTVDEPDRVRPRPADGAAVDGSVLHATLPPVSWTVLVLAPASSPATPERSRR